MSVIPKLMKDPGTGLMLPRQFVDEKQALKKYIDELVEDAVNASAHIKSNYFLVLNMKFNNEGAFNISPPMVTLKLPPFVGNSFVFWVSPSQGIVELLWMVSRPSKGGKLQVDFNKEGVAYLQAKKAMPSA